jgi:predicted aldo/keto reductase-like oxidoreductase
MAEEYLGQNTPKLGFGLMRLPRIPGGEDVIDVEQVKTMVDMFLAAGLTYFDTAYVYGGSEVATKTALVDRHPRDSYMLATKLNARAAGSEEKAKRQLSESLERTGAGYFDFYLLHAISKDNLGLYDDWGLWEFVKEAKEKGLIRHYGFSFHDTPELLDEILTKHPDVEFVQLQINYADWDNPSVTSRRNYEVARKHGKPVVIMEPVKGGTLANPPQSIRKLFKEAEPEMSVPSWAIRFAASLPGVLTVLSGMSNTEQMRDNLSYMSDFHPLDEKEQDIIQKAQEELAKVNSIPCTSCHYCTPGCPMNIPIPDIFSAMNKILIYGQKEEGQAQYDRDTKDKGKASACIECGQCEAMCPQHIQIRDRLKECAAQFE